MSDQSEHAVIVHFRYGKSDVRPIFELQDVLEAAIESASVGDLDGNEIATDGSDGYFYMYGPSADRLFEVVKPILLSVAFMHGAEIRKIYGAPGGDAPREVFILEKGAIDT